VTLRDGWEKSSNDTYDYTISNAVCGYAIGIPDEYMWEGVVIADNRGDDLHMCHMATAEEAMIWVEMTCALLE
jgi:hypothetical protein